MVSGPLSIRNVGQRLCSHCAHQGRCKCATPYSKLCGENGSAIFEMSAVSPNTDKIACPVPLPNTMAIGRYGSSLKGRQGPWHVTKNSKKLVRRLVYFPGEFNVAWGGRSL